MKTVTQKARRRQAIIKYAEKYGVTKAANRYNVNRQYIYRWKKRYDGTLESLADKSHRPHSHPNQHTEEELKLISDMRRRNPNAGLVVFWVKLRQRGYTRSITGLYRILIKKGLRQQKLPNPKYIPKPYEKMIYPGQRVQIDVKYVPTSCLVNEAKGKKFYQYTAIDEYSRFRYLEAFEEHSTYSSAIFLEHLIEAFPFPIECVQTDNGMEFTKRLAMTENPTPTLFEARLEQCGIRHKLIKPYTPRHNGKVERSHRKDNEYFYASHKFYSFDDFKKQLAVHSRKYNNFPMRPLNWHSPREYINAFIYNGEVF
ncbi:MAG: DDE-type integrase/transposase/recombinase [Clostridia bacterium]|nr:DDE-type integrase/transposase/recombinase [Clostridia bacterium]